MGPPGGRSTGRPSPPPTPGRHFSPDRTRAPEGSAPATRREPERSTAGRRPEREQGGRGATPPPPPPPPHQPTSHGGPGPHPPRQGGWTPPAREGSRSVTRPPAPAAGSNGGREEQVGPRLRTRTPRRSCPEKTSGREPEGYGGPRPPWTARRQGRPLCCLPRESGAPPPAGGSAETTSAGGNLLPHSPLTADR